MPDKVSTPTPIATVNKHRIARLKVHSIDELHEMIATVEGEITRLKSMRDGFKQEVDLEDYGELGLILHDLKLDDEDLALGINASLQNKLRRFRGKMRHGIVLAIAERVRTYLKSQEQAVSVGQDPHNDPPSYGTGSYGSGPYGGEQTSSDDTSERQAPASSSLREETFAAERWVYIAHRREVKEKIAKVVELLDELLFLSKGANLPPEDAAFTEIEREQLVALMETTLNVLRAPMIEEGLVKKMKSEGASMAAKAIKKESELALAHGLNKLKDWLGELLGILM